MKKYNLDDVVTRTIGGRDLQCIVLGEGGEGRRQTIVLVDAPLGASVGVIAPRPGSPGRPKIVNDASEEGGWLARIKKKNVDYYRGANGHVSAHPMFKVITLAEGWGAYGGAGRVGRWQDLLIQVPTGAWVRVTPARGPAYILLFKDDVYRLSYEEARAYDLDLFGSTESTEGELEMLGS